MRAGTLNRRIVIEQTSARRNEHGEDVPVWNELATVWASIKTLKGTLKSIAQADTMIGSKTVEIHIRYMPGLGVASHRLRYSTTDATKVYRINSIDDVNEDHLELVIMATEVTTP